MYNTPIRFDGDIIITDPCYIMKRNEADYSTCPSYWDFVSKKNISDYSDCRRKTIDDYPDHLKNMFKVYEYLGENLHSDIRKAELNAYYEAKDKWDEENMSDWERCNFGDDIEIFGIHTYLIDRTIYGDWSCTTYNSDTKEKIGEFCADAGMVAVFLLDEVLSYNPDFDYHTERTWTTTLIRDFHGTVELHCDGEEVTVVGRGNVNFIGKQTGF